MVNIQTQRGCAFSCCYCTYPLIEGTNYRRRSAEEIGEEVGKIARAGAPYFFIVDSVFNTSPEHVAGICEELVRRSIKIHWGCFLRPCDITGELMHLMAAAGLKHIEFGSDSMCDSVLEAYQKNFTFDDVLKSSMFARKEKIHYAHFLIIGGPTESEKTILETYSNSRKINHTVIFPFVGMRLYPGTPLYERALEEKMIDATTNLLPPWFYISSNISKSRMQELMQRFHEESPNWVIEDLPPEMVKVQNGLRDKGIPGPLWEFLAS